MKGFLGGSGGLCCCDDADLGIEGGCWIVGEGYESMNLQYVKISTFGQTIVL